MPRSVYIICAWLFAGISVALAARYGFKSADTETDGIIYAVMFGAIAAGGGLMQALAVHVVAEAGIGRAWRVFWGLAIGAIGLAAMLATVPSSLGAIAGRADALAAERSKASDAVKDDRADLVRLTAERKALTFAPADADAVNAARVAVKAAERARAAECGDGDPKQRGRFCRAKEDAERAATDKLAAVVADKAGADRTAKLDADLAAIRNRLEKAPPVQATNPLAAALARLFGMSVSDAADRRDLFLAIVLELLVAGSMIGVELTREHKIHAAPAGGTAPSNEAPQTRLMPGTVSAFFGACLPRDVTAQADMREIFDRYKRWCLESNPPLAPLPVEMFGRQFGAECKRRGIAVRREGKTVLCVGVRLVA